MHSAARRGGPLHGGGAAVKGLRGNVGLLVGTAQFGVVGQAIGGDDAPALEARIVEATIIALRQDFPVEGGVEGQVAVAVFQDADGGSVFLREVEGYKARTNGQCRRCQQKCDNKV